MFASKSWSYEPCPKPCFLTLSCLASRAALDRLYDESLERVVLFGSRARGDSDYDVAVFLKNLGDRWREIDRLAAIETDIPAETGAFIHAMPYHAGSYRERTPLMHEIRREGIDL